MSNIIPLQFKKLTLTCKYYPLGIKVFEPGLDMLYCFCGSKVEHSESLTQGYRPKFFLEKSLHLNTYFNFNQLCLIEFVSIFDQNPNSSKSCTHLKKFWIFIPPRETRDYHLKHHNGSFFPKHTRMLNLPPPKLTCHDQCIIQLCQRPLHPKCPQFHLKWGGRKKCKYLSTNN